MKKRYCFRCINPICGYYEIAGAHRSYGLYGRACPVCGSGAVIFEITTPVIPGCAPMPPWISEDDLTMKERKEMHERIDAIAELYPVAYRDIPDVVETYGKAAIFGIDSKDMCNAIMQYVNKRRIDARDEDKQ